jgi:TolB protein
VNNNSDIYVLSVDSVLQNQTPLTKRLTTNPATDFDPTWSPDGMHIAFRSQRDGNDEIYVMNADGTCQTNLTNNPLGDWSPAWSPDGKQIAFARFFDNNQFTDIAIINLDGSDSKRLTHESGEYPAWSPDGTRIAFASAREGNYEIYVMNADGTGQTRLTDNAAYDMSPTWSPDGTRIAFDTQRDDYPPVENGIGPEFEIHIMNADGSKDMRLTNNMDEDRFPSWGANDLIAFTSNGRLFVMNPNGTAQMKLLDGGSFPAWRPASSISPP